MPDYLEVCEQAARAGGAVLLDWIGRFQVREKGPADFVTEADVASQEAIREVVLGAFPEHAFLSEEDASADRDAEFRWIVDPLDGTTNYVHHIPHYAVSIALERAGKLIAGTVFDPMLNECFSAAAGAGAHLNGRKLQVSDARELRQALVAFSFPANVKASSPEIKDFERAVLSCQSVRRSGSSALNLAYVAAGRFDGYWAKETNSWDVAAGVLLVREAGGIVTALDGGNFILSEARFIAAATQSLHAELRTMVGTDRST